MATSTMTNEINFETDDQQYGYYGDRNGYFGVRLKEYLQEVRLL
ncbi:MAG: hypothetical protein R2778_07340 [Saprospiraceae bacterium]